MDLGDGNVRRTGVNTLRNAVHPHYGLAWTDGQSVFLSPLAAHAGQLHNSTPIKLGEFKYVQSLHWSHSVESHAEASVIQKSASNSTDAAAASDDVLGGAAINGVDAGAASNGTGEGASIICSNGSEPTAADEHYCYLCVVHDGSVSLWKVDGQAPNMRLRQVRKINACPIQQGCLWHPSKDILCILQWDMCSLYFRHLQNKGSYALPSIDSGQVSCGCWSEEGDQLLVAIGSIVLIYQWPDIASCVSDYTLVAWKIPGLDGQITSMVAAAHRKFVCVTEMPLEQLCASTDMFKVPDLQNGGDENGGSGDDVIRPTTNASAKDALLTLSRNTQLCVNDTSQLIVFETAAAGRGGSEGGEGATRKVARLHISGFLSPDLLHCDSVSETVVIGCNSRNVVQVFDMSDNQLTPLHEIKLNSDERPKGLCAVAECGFQGNQMLMMIGRLSNTNTEFVSASIMADYHLAVRCFSIRPTQINGDNNLHKTESLAASSDDGICAEPSRRDGGDRQAAPPVKMPRRKRKKMHSTGLDITKLANNNFNLSSSLDALQLPDDSKLSPVIMSPCIDSLRLPDSVLKGARLVTPICEIDAELTDDAATEHDGAERGLGGGGDDCASVPHLEEAIREQSAKIARLQRRIDEIQRMLAEVGNGPTAAVVGTADDTRSEHVTEGRGAEDVAARRPATEENTSDENKKLSSVNEEITDIVELTNTKNLKMAEDATDFAGAEEMTDLRIVEDTIELKVSENTPEVEKMIDLRITEDPMEVDGDAADVIVTDATSHEGEAVELRVDEDLIDAKTEKISTEDGREKMEPITSDVTPSPVASNVTPETVTGDDTPSPITSNVAPETVTSDITPSPVTSDVTPSPVTSDVTPETVTSDFTSNVTPVPVTSDTILATVTSDITPSPVTSDITLSPVTSDITLSPVTSDITLSPVTSDIMPSPVTSDITPSPVTSDITLSPVTSDITLSPVTSDITLSPVTSDIMPSPVTSDITPSPVTSDITPSPVIRDITPSPVTSDVTPSRPDVVVTQPDVTHVTPADATRDESHRPQLLHLVWHADTTVEAARVTKTFLLDSGRLKLDLVKQAFGLSTVELYFDGHLCVVGASSDGYIPMKFAPNGTMFLTGNKA